MRTLCLMLLLQIFVFSLFARGVQPEGSGTIEDPYQISALNNLEWLSCTSAAWNCFFIQTEDIDATETESWNDGAGFAPIGTVYNCFSGTYDAYGHTISNLTINRSNEDYIGFFVNLQNATVINLSLTDCYVHGASSVGGLACWANYSIISNCNISGEIHASVTNAAALAVDSMFSNMDHCYSTANVFANSGVAAGLTPVYYGANFVDCHYDYETVLINGEHVIHCGALPTYMYEDWINHDMSLNVDDYLTSNGNRYLINSFEDFQTLLAFGNIEVLNFLVTTDIDFTDHPNFVLPAMKANLDGGGHTFSNLFLEHPSYSKYLGFISVADNCMISNLSLTNLEVNGEMYVAALLGIGWYVTISNCHADGNIDCIDYGGGICAELFHSTVEDCTFNGEISCSDYGGGIAGHLFQCNCIDCHADVTIHGTKYIGGIVGSFQYNSTAIRCSSYGSVMAQDNSSGGCFGFMEEFCYAEQCFSAMSVDGYYASGGFAGQMHGTTLRNCYSLGSVQGEEYIGGITGKATPFNGAQSNILNCYTACAVGDGDYSGGVVGFRYEGSVENTFWDLEASGTDQSEGGTGKTHDEMREIATYTSLETEGLDEPWDFIGDPNDDTGLDDVWRIHETLNDGLPCFTWQEFMASDEDTIDAPQLTSTLHCIYPNPFNPETTISFSVATGETATIEIFNIRGQRVKSFDRFHEGQHNTVWNGTDDSNRHVGSGIYFCRLLTGSRSEVRKLMLLK